MNLGFGNPFGLGLVSSRRKNESECFRDACFEATKPPGLLGGVCEPTAYRRLISQFSKPQGKWRLEEWKLAARILGFYADELMEQRRRDARAFEKRSKGRPRKFIVKGLLSDSLDEPKKRGRKLKITDRHHKNLLRFVAELQAAWGIISGRGAIKRVLTRLIENEAKQKNVSKTKLLREKLPYWQKRYSKAKGKFPNFPN